MPGYASPGQIELLSKLLQSHVFTTDERDTIIGSMEWYTGDEAAVNVDWVLSEIKERKRAEAATELMQVVKQNREHVSDEMYDQLKALSENKDIPPGQYNKLKTELLNELAEVAFAEEN